LQEKPVQPNTELEPKGRKKRNKRNQKQTKRINGPHQSGETQKNT
jgi:hypothetical protein